MNDENVASNGLDDERDVCPEGRSDHTLKAARTILVRDSVDLT